MATHSPDHAEELEPCSGRVLVVDDEPTQAMLASEILRPEGHAVETALSGAEAIERLSSQPFDVVIADLMMPGMDGFELLQRIGEAWPDVPVIFLTGHADVASAVDAIKQGAENYLTKPFDVDRLRVVVLRALEKKALRDDNARLRRLIWRRRTSYGTLLGSSEPMQVLYDQIDAVAPTQSTVLLLGESGTGKDLTAREIHRRSKRREGPFLGVNCGALPANLLESELFGHERGAFTGASSSKVGLFEAADRGTIFLDEIGTTAMGTQQALLRVLQDREVRRVGGTSTRAVDVRVVCATNADLQVEIAESRFRSDLYFRLSGVIIRLPALRERRGDLPTLAEHFLAQACHRHGKQMHSFTQRAVETLQRHPWPGNIRELENVVERAVIFATRTNIGPRELQFSAETGPATQKEQLGLDEVVRSHLVAALEKCGGNKMQAARLLKIPRTSLYKKLKKYGLD